MGPKLPKRLQFLLAEDLEDDAFFFQRGLEGSHLNASSYRVKDGAQAIAYLKAEPPFNDRGQHPFPDLIFTDLKMPRCDGFDFLEWVKNHANCSVIPTIVLTASFEPKDVRRAYDLGANAFFSKPTRLEELSDIIVITYHFWSRCQRPPLPAHLRCE